MYRNIFIISACLSGVMFVVSVFLFFRFNIIKIIGDITGVTAKRAINDIRSHNVQPRGKKAFTLGLVNSARVKLTDEITDSEKTMYSTLGSQMPADMDRVNTQKLDDTGETTVIAPVYFEVEYDITYIHTSEVIH